MITHDYKLIFIHIPKCAGRSVSEIFNQRFDQYCAAYYWKEYSRFWNSYEKFAIVRNPYSRLVSMYHYIQQHRRHKFEPIANARSNFKEWVMANFNAFKAPFNLGSPEAERGTDWMLGSPHWFSPQHRFLCDPYEGYVNEMKVFKLEHGLQYVSEFLKERGVANADIPVLNTSKHEPWETYYDEELIRFVNHFPFIYTDCHEFGYNLL